MGITQEEFERRRAARKEPKAKAREAQADTDREAILAYEDAEGVELDTSLTVRNFVEGHPSILGVRAPAENEYKRFAQSINRSGNADAKMAAIELLGKTCWAYPENEESRKAIIAANPAIILQCGNLANKMAEARAAEEGKD